MDKTLQVHSRIMASSCRTCRNSEAGKCVRLQELAERQGFEPWVQLSPYNRLATCRLKPLGHLSVVLLRRAYHRSPLLTTVYENIYANNSRCGGLGAGRKYRRERPQMKSATRREGLCHSLGARCISSRKLVPFGRSRPKFSATVAPISARVARVPRFTPPRIPAPIARTGTYSRE